MSKRRQLVVVEWVDSHGGNGWQWLDELEDGHATPMHCRSVGWLVAKRNGVHVLASHLSGEANGNLRVGARGDLTIPDACITKVRRLRDSR